MPTLAESGLPDFRTEFIMGVVAPAGTPAEIVELLNRRIVAILRLPDVQERLKTLGYEPVGSTPDEFSARIKADSETWSKVVRQAGIKIRVTGKPNLPAARRTQQLGVGRPAEGRRQSCSPGRMRL